MQEFRRKVRIVAGGYQAFLRHEGVPRWNDFRLLWLYVSHKLLRWLAPVFLTILLASSIALAGARFYAAALATQVILYSLAWMGGRFASLNAAIFRIPYYFALVNLAAMSGLVRALTGKETVLWSRASRAMESH